MKVVKLASGVALALTLALVLAAQSAKASDHGPGGIIVTSRNKSTGSIRQPGEGGAEHLHLDQDHLGRSREPVGLDQPQAHARQMKAQGWVR